MRERRLRDLVHGPPPGPERIFWSALWFREANNQRYSELIPRLERLDAYFIRVAGRRIPRGVQYRAYRYAPGRYAQRALLPLAARRYRGMFCTEPRQIAAFPGLVVVDVDEAFFSDRAVAFFRRPNVAALVTTAEWAIERYRELGVTAPMHVIPQGVTFRRGGAPEIPRRGRGDLVVAYLAAWLLSEGDPGSDNPLYNVDHLLELWDLIRERVPGARLWLIGGPGARLRERAAGRDDVELIGRIPRDQVLTILSNADLALYPRRQRAGVASAKIADYLAAGLPIVSYDEPQVTAQLAPTGAGVIVESPTEFVDAVVRLGRDEAARTDLAEAARRAGRELDWDVLAARYGELLDRYLPPA